MTTRFLFLCDHSAGKSVLGATYFRAAAARRGFDVDVEVAGPDPDDEVMESVSASLAAQGFDVDFVPRLVTGEDFGRVDQVINVGADPAALPEAEGCDNMITWSVPMLSKDFAASVDAIYRHAEEMAERMGRNA